MKELVLFIIFLAIPLSIFAQEGATIKESGIYYEQKVTTPFLDSLIRDYYYSTQQWAGGRISTLNYRAVVIQIDTWSSTEGIVLNMRREGNPKNIFRSDVISFYMLDDTIACFVSLPGRRSGLFTPRTGDLEDFLRACFSPRYAGNLLEEYTSDGTPPYGILVGVGCDVRFTYTLRGTIYNPWNKREYPFWDVIYHQVKKEVKNYCTGEDYYIRYIFDKESGVYIEDIW